MKLLDRFGKPFGELSYDVFRHQRDGSKVLIERVREPNLIVDNAKTLHARLIGGDVTNRSVTQFGVGTSGTAPAGGNTVLTGSFLKAVDGVSYPAANQVSFAFSLASGEANGKAILEFGLLTPTNVLYARRIRTTALNKESDISFTGAWVITFP